jgi:hypothetical protein
MHNGKPCCRDLYDDKCCVFYSEDMEGKKEKFMVTILGYAIGF